MYIFQICELTDRQTDKHTDTLIARLRTLTGSDNNNNNEAIVDYTSPALCTPVTPFPPIGDAVYR